jgi:Na+-transporting methylmalonyl-CoA/oxaloacetate decarboxylase gamma subunit
MSTLASALWITLIGMGLVFIALILLWGLMALMVSATTKMAEKEAAEAAASDAVEEESTAVAGEEPVLHPGADLRIKAAAAAVAVALQMQAKTIGQQVNLPAPEPFSAWQSVMRANRLTQKSRTYARK